MAGETEHIGALLLEEGLLTRRDLERAAEYAVAGNARYARGDYRQALVLFRLALTENRVVPLPIRPLDRVTAMSKYASRAVSATSIVVTSSLELRNVTLRTVMPPGLVVPDTRYCTLAVGSKPLPLTTTSRATVP